METLGEAAKVLKFIGQVTIKPFDDAKKLNSSKSILIYNWVDIILHSKSRSSISFPTQEKSFILDLD